MLSIQIDTKNGVFQFIRLLDTLESKNKKFGKHWCISSLFLVLSSDNSKKNETDLSTCGINYCPAAPKNESEESESEESGDDNFSATPIQLYILAGVYLACSLAAALTVALFVTPLTE